MDALASVFDIPSGCEITVEVGARSFTRSIATTFQKCGVSNIRIGVQSFNASARRLFCLSAQVSDVAAAVEHARAANLAVSFDLLFGYHGQTIDDMITDLKVAHNLEPDTIETYSLNLLSAPQRYWDAVAFEGVPRVTARQRLEYYSAARSTLINLGYHQWSGHGFARSPTFDLLYHRCVYGSLGGYLGFGPGAVSLGPTLLKINHNDIERYLKSEPSKPHYCTFPISEQDHTRKRFISELPYYGSCEVGSTLDEEVGSRMKELEAAQIVIREDNTLVLADRAWPQYASIMYFLLPKRDRAALGLEMFEKLASLGNSFSKDMLWL
jgi:oxygen-independent coproporphyrinogen-3 oxidase